MHGAVDAQEAFWKRRARWLAAKRNVAAWLQAFLPGLLAASGVMACVILVLRRMGIPVGTAWMVFGGLAALGACLCAGWVIRRRFSARDALVRLDVVLRLHNQLTAAAAGVGRWPEPRAAVDDGLRWRWSRVLLPWGLSGALLAAAMWIPIRRGPASVAAPQEPPVAVSQVAEWLEELEREDLVENAAIEHLREQVESLRDRPPEEWYEHANLEAADSLRQETEESLRALARNLQQAADALAIAQQKQEQWASIDRDTLSAALQQAMQGLAQGKLPLEKALLARLRSLDLSKAREISAAEWKEIEKRLREGSETCASCLGERGILALGDRLKTGRPGGGPGGGGGPAELTRKEHPTRLGSKTQESVANDDLSRALPGDVLATAKGEHEIDESAYGGAVAGGAVSAAGTGGEAVWTQSLDPDEQAVLQRYFK